jgi:hypothetical protein
MFMVSGTLKCQCVSLYPHSKSKSLNCSLHTFNPLDSYFMKFDFEYLIVVA